MNAKFSVEIRIVSLSFENNIILSCCGMFSFWIIQQRFRRLKNIRWNFKLCSEHTSSHANLFKHLNKCSYTDSPLCLVCGKEGETPFHFVGRWPEFFIPRNKLYGLPIISFDQVSFLQRVVWPNRVYIRHIHVRWYDSCNT